MDIRERIKEEESLFENETQIASPENRIQTVMDIESVTLNIETAAPCGLIINELVSNSIKYAFTPRKEGEIYVSLKKAAEDYELVVGDNGRGIPEEVDFKNTKSLGLQLVNNLVTQLNGDIELDRRSGTTYKIKFKELKYKERF